MPKPLKDDQIQLLADAVVALLTGDPEGIAFAQFALETCGFEAVKYTADDIARADAWAADMRAGIPIE